MLDTIRSRKNQSGFTIIEVLIVLAIAGLIMVVVFLAIPNLQRSQRNNSRKTDANNILSSLSDYVSNNGGALPTASCTGSACAFLGNLKLGYFTTANVSYVTPFPTGTIPTPNTNQAVVYAGGTCASAAVAPTVASSTRGIAIYYGIEGNVPTQCISE